MNLYKLAIGITDTLQKDNDTIDKNKLRNEILNKRKTLLNRKSNNNTVNNYYYNGNNIEDDDEDSEYLNKINDVQDNLNDVKESIYHSLKNVRQS